MSKNIPELRFPEFKGEWETKKLGEVTDKIQDGTHFSPSVVENGNRKYITSKNIRNGYMDLKDISLISESAHNEIYKRCDVKYNDVLITKDGASTGNACLNELHEEFSLLSSVAFIREKESISINGFIYQYISTPIGQNEIQSFIAGQAITRITLTKLNKFKINLPCIKEQTRIATFLTAVDSKLSQLKKKKVLLEQYKKGAMQKIFSQEIRFKDENGQEFPEWEMNTLKNIAKILYGKDQKQVLDFNGKYPILGTGGVIGKTNQFLYNLPSVLIGRKGTIDKPVYMDTPFWTVDTLFYTEVYSSTFPKWLYYKFQTINWYLYNEASGVPSLSASTIYKIPIHLPCLLEQTKIANFLSAIDEKIAYCSKQIEKTEQWKKGLLQKMFV